jgi:CheY-like chemotaxis protein
LARRILLADDSVTAQNMGRRILHDAGYEIVTVNNGSAALKKVAEQKPDLIILDVYMPGYGGLEVCSRLKENRETQRIPVLLTVGKLEPFKPEEARRVRADAYIVKPFEASELLSALTKLEDKIVPGPEPNKPGRFAKALASVEQSDDRDFGDKETGWKDRLIIPGKKGKKSQVEPEAEAAPAKPLKVVERGEDFRPAEPKSGFERPIPAGLPQDISAEEIAAIAAAAAKISDQSAAVVEAHAAQETKPAETKPEATPQEAVAANSPETPAPAAGSSVSPASENATQDAPATFASAAPEGEESSAKADATPEPVRAQGAPVNAEPEKPSPTEAADGQEEKRPASDAEVLAALAALTPSNGDFSSPAATEHDAESAAARASYIGPRWIAEAVAVSDEESSFLLQHEMEKAHAAFAAADAGRAVLLLSAGASNPSNGNGHSLGEHTTPQATAVAEPETKSEEASAVPAQEPRPEAPVEAVASETAFAAAESALAAAASAGGQTETTISEPQAVASTQPSGHEEGSRMGEAELAAAWANWRNIRESIIGPQTSDVQEPASENEYKPAETATPATEEPVAEPPKAEAAAEAAQPEEVKSETSAAEDPARLASIVDNMLAELKPKLMEELKRKLGK